MRNQATFIATDETTMTPGSKVEDQDGTVYLKVKAAGTIAINTLVKIGTAAFTTERGFTVPSVVIAAEILDAGFCIGWNNAGAVVSGDFFWVKVGPYVTGLGGTVGVITRGEDVYPSTTDGEVDDANTAASQAVGVWMSADTSGVIAGTIKSNLTA